MKNAGQIRTSRQHSVALGEKLILMVPRTT
jgi:hypothetical protein